jgi:TolB-like protein/Tfp pilus assembly protein PilF
MSIWSAEIKELERLNLSLAGHFPLLEKEMGLLLKTEDENVAMLYSRRCLEVIVTDLCENELNRPRKTEPLKGIIDKLNKEEKVPSYIITSMHSLNSLSTYGAHPKDFDPEQVKPALNNLAIVVKWYLRYKGIEILIEPSAGKAKTIAGDGKQQTEATRLEKSIAVLPFINDSPDQENTYFINGVMEEILNNLQKIKDLRVISRTSAEKFRGQNKSIPEIAEELGVNFIVEGSGQKYGNAFRLRAQLIMAAKETHLWGESFQSEINDVKDIFNIQIKIAKSLAEELKAVISPEEKRLIEKIPSADLEVYDKYLKARSYWTDFTKEALTKALEFLNSAVEKDPSWAPLYAGLTEVWMTIQQLGYEPPSVAGPKIIENLNKALELDPDLSNVHFISAMIAHLMEWDWEKSEKEFLKALAINPGDAIARICYAQLLVVLNRNDEALTQGHLANSLDPLNSTMKMLYGWLLLAVGDCKSSLSVGEEALAADPGNWVHYTTIETAAYRCKEYDKVIKAVRYALPFPVEEDEYKEIERIYHEHGIATAYEEIMKLLENFAQNNPITFMDMAMRYVYANKPDKAMEWIEKGLEMHDPQMTYITTLGYNLDPLFKIPRFIEIADQMKLPVPKTD